MSKTITIRLDDKLAEMLDHIADGTARTKSDIIRDCLRRQLSIRLLDLAREKLVPLAEKKGIFTDEDVFEMLKRDPETGEIECIATKKK
jgi:predicted transcriptional regulator